MRFALLTFSTKLSILTPAQIFSGDIPFQDISCWSSLRSDVVKYGKRPAKPEPHDDIGRELDDKLWSLIEECWSQESSNRPTAEIVSLRLGGVNGCLVNPAEMYKKEIAALTEELARERERSKAARKDFETELARQELEKAELKKDLDEERHLRKQVEKNAEQVAKNADERIKSVRQDLETELAKLRDSLAKRKLEQADLKKDLDEERLVSESDTPMEEGHFSILRSDGPGLSPNEPMAIVQRPLIPDGRYAIKSRAKSAAKHFFWNSAARDPITTVHFWSCEMHNMKNSNLQVNNHSPIIKVIKG